MAMKLSKINAFLKRINYNRNSYYSKKYYYESLYDSFRDLKGYYELLVFESHNLLKTDKIISLLKGQAFNVRKNKILEKYKKPRIRFRIIEQSFEIDIFIYIINLGEHPVRLEIHLNKGLLFYYKYSFSQSENINCKHKQKIIKIIQDKYLHGAAIDITSQNIIDKNQTILKIEDNVNFNIHYANFSSATFKELMNYREYYERRVARKNKMKLRELKERL